MSSLLFIKTTKTTRPMAYCVRKLQMLMVNQIEVHEVRVWKFVNFRKISDIYYTSRLSSQLDEICLQKSLPNSGEQSITNYLKQNDFEYRSHLTIENNLKVEKNVIISKTNTPLPPIKTFGVRVETSIPANQWQTINHKTKRFWLSKPSDRRK